MGALGYTTQGWHTRGMKTPTPQITPKDLAKIYGQALARLRDRTTLNQTDAASRIETTQQTWGRWETGANQAFLDLINQQKAVEALGFTMADLEVEIENVTLNRLTDQNLAPVDDEPRPDFSLPIDGVVRAGPMGMGIYDGRNDDTLDLNTIFDANTRGLWAMGDSMYPLIEDGTLVTYKLTGVPRRNKLCVIRFHNGHYLVKKFIAMTKSEVHCVEMEPLEMDGRTVYAEKVVKFSVADVRAVYPASVRID